MASNVIRLSTPDAAVGGNFASNKKTILRFNRLAQSILQGSLLLISKWGMGVGATNANIFLFNYFVYTQITVKVISLGLTHA